MEKPDLFTERDLIHLLFYQPIVNLARHLKDHAKEDSRTEKVAQKYVKILERCNSLSKAREHYDNFRREVDEAFTALGYPGMVNMGDELSVNTLVLIILHFATEAEKDVKMGSDKRSKMDHKKAACLVFAKVTFVGSFIREYARNVLGMSRDEARAYWDRHKPKILEAIAIVDHRLIISKDKDNFEQELKDLAKLDNTSVETLTLLGAINTAFHNLHHYLLHNGQRKLMNIVFSTSVHKFALGECGTKEFDLAHIAGCISHPETWLASYISNLLQYTDERLRGYEYVAAIGLHPLLYYILGEENLEPREQPYFVTTEIARNWAYGNLTPEEREEKRQLLLEICIRGGITCGLMRTLVSKIMKLLMSSKTPMAEAIEQLPAHVEELATRHALKSGDEEDSNDEIAVAFANLVNHQPRKLKDIPRLAANMKSLYGGSLLTGLMRTLAAAIVDSLVVKHGISDEDAVEQIPAEMEVLKKCYDSRSSECIDCNDAVMIAFASVARYRPDSLADIPRLAANMKSLYEGSLFTGLMNTLASEIVASLVLKHGISDEDAVEQIPAMMEVLKKHYDSRRADGGIDCNDSAMLSFTALARFRPDSLADIPRLAANMKSLYEGSIAGGKTNKLILALAMILGNLIMQQKIEIEAANQQIPTALVELKSRHASSANVDVNDAPLVAFDNLIKHQPKLSKDIASLTPTVQHWFKHTFGAWEKMFVKLEEYKATVFDLKEENKGNAFSVSLTTHPSLSTWFSKYVRLFNDPHWRSKDDHICSCLGWKSVDEHLKCILDQRQQKLLGVGGVVLDIQATRKRENRGNDMKIARRKRLANKR